MKGAVSEETVMLHRWGSVLKLSLVLVFGSRPFMFRASKLHGQLHLCHLFWPIAAMLITEAFALNETRETYHTSPPSEVLTTSNWQEPCALTLNTVRRYYRLNTPTC